MGAFPQEALSSGGWKGAAPPPCSSVVAFFFDGVIAVSLEFGEFWEAEVSPVVGHSLAENHGPCNGVIGVIGFFFSLF